jgi:hypothetical protein
MGGTHRATRRCDVTCTRLAHGLALTLLVGCAAPAPPARMTQPAPASPPAAVTAGIVWWPADPADPMRALLSDIEACLTARIREVAPEIVVLPQRVVRDALFPLLEPATQPSTEAAFAALLAREDVHARLAQHGLRYLIAFAGGTQWANPGGFILCGVAPTPPGGGGCLGFAWQGETTTLDAALWSLGDATGVRHEGAKVEGAIVVPAFVLPIPIPARTKAGACRELGTRIATAIRQMAAERAGKP